MRDTRFDARSSEWIGDMTVWLRDHAEDNSEQLERLRRGLRRAREQELTPRQRETENVPDCSKAGGEPLHRLPHGEAG